MIRSLNIPRTCARREDILHACAVCTIRVVIHIRMHSRSRQRYAIYRVYHDSYTNAHKRDSSPKLNIHHPIGNKSPVPSLPFQSPAEPAAIHTFYLYYTHAHMLTDYHAGVMAASVVAAQSLLLLPAAHRRGPVVHVTHIIHSHSYGASA